MKNKKVKASVFYFPTSTKGKIILAGMIVAVLLVMPPVVPFVSDFKIILGLPALLFLDLLVTAVVIVVISLARKWGGTLMGGNWMIAFAIMVIYTLATIVVGLRKKNVEKVASEYEEWGNSGRKTSALVAFFLIGAADVSAYTFLGSPGFAFTDGTSAFYVPMYLAILVLLYYIIGPRAWRMSYEHKMLTQAQCFGERYESKGVRILIAASASFCMLFYMILQIVGCGYIINFVSGDRIPVWVAQLIILAVIFTYTYKGGLSSTGKVAVLQGSLMLAVCWVIPGVISYEISGSVWPSDLIQQALDIKPINFDLGSWTTASWTSTMLVAILSMWPTTWLWMTSLKSQSEIRKTLNVQPIFYLMMLPMIIVGFMGVAVASGYADAPDTIMLHLASSNLSIILVGIVGAAVLAASQSSAGPILQAMTFLWVQDVIEPLTSWDEKKLFRIQKIILAIIAFGILFPLAATNPSQMQYLLALGFSFTGQSFPLLIGTFFWPCSNKHGALFGFVAGVITVALCTWVWPYPLGIDPGIWGLMLNVTIHIVVSLFTPSNSKETLTKFFPKHVMDRLYN